MDVDVDVGVNILIRICPNVLGQFIDHGPTVHLIGGIVRRKKIRFSKPGVLRN